ncbi:MAG: hypothetical protein AAF914_13325, partial [Pseudomonadota bacterium]
MAPALGRASRRRAPVGDGAALRARLIRLGALSAGAAATLPPGDGIETARHLVASGLAGEAETFAALAATGGGHGIDLATAPADPDLATLLTAQLAIAFCAVPHARRPGRVVVATARPELKAQITAAFAPNKIDLVLAPRRQVEAEITRLYGPELAQRAATSAPLETSARIWTAGAMARWLALPLLA